MEWKNRELKSPHVIKSNLKDNEKELIKLYVNCAIMERLNFNEKGKYFDGIQTGIAQSLKLLERNDIWELINSEFMYHDELNQ